MRWLYYPLWTLYRVWFYILMGGYILVMFPFLFISILSESFYPFFFVLARGWAWFVLTGMGFRVKKYVQQPIDPQRSYMFIANHTSMTDIMLMLVLVKNPFVFVGKKELANIPVFGFFLQTHLHFGRPQQPQKPSCCVPTRPKTPAIGLEHLHFPRRRGARRVHFARPLQRRRISLGLGASNSDRPDDFCRQ